MMVVSFCVPIRIVPKSITVEEELNVPVGAGVVSVGPVGVVDELHDPTVRAMGRNKRAIRRFMIVSISWK
jgi:hypothetical protein